jgi:predicted enzyme related to lactoylglutathione lyase
MITSLSIVCIPVKDYDEAIAWYQDKLGFEVLSNESFGGQYRWVTVGVPNQKGIEISLFKNSDDPSQMKVEKVNGWCFGTDDCRKTVAELKEKGVAILMEPNDAPWGTQAVFTDLYGNTFVLVEARNNYTQEELDHYNM